MASTTNSKKRVSDGVRSQLDASRQKRHKFGYRPQRLTDERNTETQTEWVSACIDEGFAGKVPGGAKGSLFPSADQKAGKLQARGYFIGDHNAVTVPQLKRLVKKEVGEKSCGSHRVLVVPQSSIYAGWKKFAQAASIEGHVRRVRTSGTGGRSTIGASNDGNEWRNGELRWVQTGMGPNYQGGVTTLTACRHEKRCTKSVMEPAQQLQGDGTKLWLAVVVSKTSLKDGLGADHRLTGNALKMLAHSNAGKRFMLVSLHRIKQGYSSQEELWNALTDDARKAKNNVENRIGDVFVPSLRPPSGSNAKEVRFYEEPNFHFRHWYEELYDPEYAARRRTQEDVSVRGGLLLRSYAADEARPGTSFVFGALKSSPGFWDSKYSIGMIPHGGVISLTQFLRSLYNKAPKVEALVTAGRANKKKACADAKRIQKPRMTYRKSAIDACLMRLRKTHGYIMNRQKGNVAHKSLKKRVCL